MIAMQYSIVLPADYDMQIVKDRIASKGALLDEFPGLVFKAFLYACKDAAPTHSADNLYAPFYLWENNDAMNRFLAGPGFAALCESFGRPVINVWSLWGHALHEKIKGARYASREISSIPSRAPLGDIQGGEHALLRKSMDHPSSLAALSAFEPTTWTNVRFRLSKDVEHVEEGGSVQRYEVGYVATGSKWPA